MTNKRDELFKEVMEVLPKCARLEEDMKVLYIDDEQYALSGFESHFRRDFGRENIFLAQNLSEALEILKDNKINVIVTDYSLPKMNGYEIRQEIKKQYPEIPFILFTGVGAPLTEKKEFFDVVYKPLESDGSNLMSSIINAYAKPNLRMG